MNKSNQTNTCPAILVAATASGQGKTTIVSALARLHSRQGRRVSVFKCGPDFLDPYWHELASGNPVYQVDLWITGEDDARARLSEAARNSDLIIVEGVMGLFDGTPSAADLSLRLKIPVLAIIDASAMAGTFGALAYGLQHYRPDLPWAGVFANKVASEGHGAMLEHCVAKEHWRGYLKKLNTLALPERHLGLTVATELTDAMSRLDAAADELAETPLGKMDAQALQEWAVSFPTTSETEVPKKLAGMTIAVARDAAFCFIYQANLETLQALGAALSFFSPVAGDRLPKCDAVWLPGGYPELHSSAINANQALMTDLKLHHQQGKPIWAECGGMMVLFEVLHMTDGSTSKMWGLLPGTVTVHKKLAALGPQQLTLRAGVLRGHTFHYSTATTNLPAVERTTRPFMSGQSSEGEVVYSHGSLRASYFHPWFASDPLAAADLFCAEQVELAETVPSLHQYQGSLKTSAPTSTDAWSKE
jgi:cobyrinic acid a,c-diamide synthase